VVPKADPGAGETPKAFVVRAPGRSTTQGELIAFVADRGAGYKKVREIEFVDSSPKSPSGKILRRVRVGRDRDGLAQRS